MGIFSIFLRAKTKAEAISLGVEEGRKQVFQECLLCIERERIIGISGKPDACDYIPLVTEIRGKLKNCG